MCAWSIWLAVHPVVILGWNLCADKRVMLLLVSVLQSECFLFCLYMVQASVIDWDTLVRVHQYTHLQTDLMIGVWLCSTTEANSISICDRDFSLQLMCIRWAGTLLVMFCQWCRLLKGAVKMSQDDSRVMICSKCCLFIQIH